MRQAGQERCFALEGYRCLDQFLGREILLAHLFNGYQAVAKLRIGRLVNRAEPTLAHLDQHAIALLQSVTGGQETRLWGGVCCAVSAKQLTTGEAKGGLHTIRGSTSIAIARRKCHRSSVICYLPDLLLSLPDSLALFFFRLRFSAHAISHFMHQMHIEVALFSLECMYHTPEMESRQIYSLAVLCEVASTRKNVKRGEISRDIKVPGHAIIQVCN